LLIKSELSTIAIFHPSFGDSTDRLHLTVVSRSYFTRLALTLRLSLDLLLHIPRRTILFFVNSILNDATGIDETLNV